MIDSAEAFTDPTVGRPSAADRPVNDLSGNRFHTGAADAARQAAASEARVLGVDQDKPTAGGAADAVSGLATQRAGIASPPAPGPQFGTD